MLSCTRFPNLVGQFGHVLGMSYVDDDPESGEVCRYAVFFEDLSEVFSFDIGEVEGTGEVANRDRFYPV